jgi:hypothetical protein
LHLIRRLILAWQGSQSSDHTLEPIHKFLIEQLQLITETQTSATLFCEAVSSTEKSEAIKNFDFEIFIKDLPLEPLEKVRLAIALLQSPKPDLVSQGIYTSTCTIALYDCFAIASSLS